MSAVWLICFSSSKLRVSLGVISGTSLVWQTLTLSVFSPGLVELRGEEGCTGWWSECWPPDRVAPRTQSCQKWWEWSVEGASGAVRPCPVQWPWSGSAWPRHRTHERVGGCDLQGEQARHGWVSGGNLNPHGWALCHAAKSIMQDSRWQLYISVMRQWLTQMRIRRLCQ